MVKGKAPTDSLKSTPAADTSELPSDLKELVAAAQHTFATIGVTSFSSARVAAAMKDLSVLRSAVNAFDAALRTRAKELQPPPEPSPLPEAVPPESSDPPVPDSGPSEDVSPPILDWFSGLTSQQGRARDRHARVLAQMPALAKALAAGRIADGHVAVLAEILFSATHQVWAGLVREQAELARIAGQMNPLPFKRYVHQATHRIAAEADASITRDLESEISAAFWIDRNTGLGRLSATFDPMSYAKIAKILSRLAGHISYKQRTMTRKEATGRALIQLLTNSQSDPSDSPRGSGAPSATMSVLIDQRTLVQGAHADTICEHADGSRIPVGVAREIACEASLTPIWTSPSGVVLDMGRGQRWATPNQRRALEAMYATCAITACDIPVTECQDHHITYWEHGGRTDLANLLPVCEHHHRWIHANNPKVRLDPHRTLTISMANGTTTTHYPDRRSHRRCHSSSRSKVNDNDSDPDGNS
jgi:hypothetical protein